MNKLTKITIAVLAIFVIGMTISVAFADPVSAVKYKGKKSFHGLPLPMSDLDTFFI